jgi:hypothetical protein
MELFIFTVYKITNLLNNKIYVGVHKTIDPNDGYYGSGDAILKAIKKYGKQNFKKEIIGCFDTKEDAYYLERQIVNEDFVKRSDTYNRCCGGFGGGIEIANKNGLNNKNKNYKKISQTLKILWKTNPEKFANWIKSKDWTGRKHTEETKRKMSLTQKKLKTEFSHTKGRIWVNNGTKQCMVNLTELPEGYARGRLPRPKKEKTATPRKFRVTDEEIKIAWIGLTKVVEVARKLGYHNPNSIGKTYYRILKFKPNI